jgi:hypothetical protein
VRGDPTQADKDLASAASRFARLPISAYQVERWREAGVLRTERPSRGHGRGWEKAKFVDGSVEHAACIARILTEQVPPKSLDRAALLCFWREGHTPRKRVLDRIYKRFLDIGQVVDDGQRDPWQIAGRVAGRVSRRTARNPIASYLRERLNSPSDLWKVLQNMIAVGLGAKAPISPLVMQALGLSADTPMEPPRHSIPELVEAVRSSPLEELEQARDDGRRLAAIGDRVLELVTRDLGLLIQYPLGGKDKELFEALYWVPQSLLRRRALGAEKMEETLNTIELGLQEELEK